MARIVLPLYTPRYVPNGNETAAFVTSKGVVKVILNGQNAPKTVGNFIELAHKGFYNNVKFHSYKPGSIIIGGCPLTRTLGPAQVDAAARGLVRGIHPGVGDARYTIEDEYEGKENNHHLLGSLCFAHKSDPDSGSCQFYFSLCEQPEFDAKFTVFGMTVEGIDVVRGLRVGDSIMSVKIEHADEVALAAAVAQDPPRPVRAGDVFEQIKQAQMASSKTIS